MAWIRSQRRNFLLNVSGAYISTDGLAIYALPEPQDYEIGKFSSPEFALAELDRIERWIGDGEQDVYQVSQEP